jgi:hypothetical protein
VPSRHAARCGDNHAFNILQVRYNASSTEWPVTTDETHCSFGRPPAHAMSVSSTAIGSSDAENGHSDKSHPQQRLSSPDPWFYSPFRRIAKFKRPTESHPSRANDADGTSLGTRKVVDGTHLSLHMLRSPQHVGRNPLGCAGRCP